MELVTEEIDNEFPPYCQKKYITNPKRIFWISNFKYSFWEK